MVIVAYILTTIGLRTVPFTNFKLYKQDFHVMRKIHLSTYVLIAGTFKGMFACICVCVCVSVRERERERERESKEK